MKIRENDFLWKLVYFWREHPPKSKIQINILRFFLDFILGSLLLWLLLGIIYCLVVISTTIGTFLVARRFLTEKNEEGKFIVRCKRWPKIGGYRVYPIVILAVIAVIYFAYVVNYLVIGLALAAILIISVLRLWRSKAGFHLRKSCSTLSRKIFFVEIIPLKPEDKKG